MREPRVDIIVPTYNRPERLRRCLEALARQSFRDLRVIVVDDGSSPPVAPALAASPIKDLSITVVRPERNSGVSVGRNLGVMAGSAPLIGFIDDDIFAHQECIGTLVATLDKHPGPAVVIGTARAPEGWRPTPWNLWEWRTLKAIYEGLHRGDTTPNWRTFYLGISLLRREDFVAAGGFDTRFRRAEDIEFGVRLEKAGLPLLLAWDAIGWHHSERSFEGWLSIARDYAWYQAAIDHLHPHLHWLESAHAETRGAGLLGRLRRLPIYTPGIADPSAAIAKRLVPALCRAGHEDVAMKALSFAYLATYVRGLRAAEANREGIRAAFQGPTPPLPSPESARARIVLQAPAEGAP